MIICLIGWALWLCVQVFMACFTPFRLRLLNEHGRYYNKIDVVLRYMSIKARWVQKEYEFYFWTPPLTGCRECDGSVAGGLCDDHWTAYYNSQG